MKRMQFSRAVLLSRVTREINVCERGGSLVLEVAFYSQGSPCGAVIFGREHWPMLARAIGAARDPELVGSRVIGEIRHSDVVALRVRATAYPGFPRAVGWRRWLVPEGRWLGRETRLAGDELDGLEAAILHLTSAALGVAESVGP